MRYLDNCPICNHKNFAQLTGYDRKVNPEAYKYLGLSGRTSSWSVCKYCGFLFQNPRPEPETIISFYEKNFYRKNREYDEWFFKTRYERPQMHLKWAERKTESGISRILDIGAGHGGAVRAFRDLGLNAEGIEIDTALCKEALERYDIELIHSSIMDCHFEESSFDAVYSSHVHEHLDDFIAVNRKLASWIRPGGYLICVLPTYRFAMTNGQGFINVFHNSIFTKKSLYNMFVISGLIPELFHYPLNWSTPEIWGLASVGLLDSNINTGIKRDNSFFVLKEIKYGSYFVTMIYYLLRLMRYTAKPVSVFRKIYRKLISVLNKK